MPLLLGLAGGSALQDPEDLRELFDREADRTCGTGMREATASALVPNPPAGTAKPLAYFLGCVQFR